MSELQTPPDLPAYIVRRPTGTYLVIPLTGSAAKLVRRPRRRRRRARPSARRS
jgi:hypothetical protein